MKRIFITLLALMAMAGASAMTESRVRTETLFLTDKMSYELRLSSSQYNDVYEINYDFMSAVCNIMDDVVYGESWALNDYYEALDIRNDDLRWVLSASQYRRFLGAEYFCRPVYQTNGGWGLRIYITYTNPSVYYCRWPSAYTTYFGGHYRGGFDDTSYYRYRYSRVSHYNRPFRMNGDGYRYNTYVNRDFQRSGDNRYYNNRNSNPGFHIGNGNSGNNNNRGNRSDNNRYYDNNGVNNRGNVNNNININNTNVNTNRNYNRNNGGGYDRNIDNNSSRGKNVDVNTNNTNTNVNNTNVNTNRNYNRNNGGGYDKNIDNNSSRGKNVDVNTNNTNTNVNNTNVNTNRNYNRNNGVGSDKNVDNNSSRNKNVDVNKNSNGNSSRRNYDRPVPASSTNKVITTPTTPAKNTEKHSRR